MTMPSPPSPVQEHNFISPTRIDGVAAAAKDAETTVSLAMTQSTSSLEEVEELNRNVLIATGVPDIRVRKYEKCRPVGDHIEFRPAEKHVVARPGSSHQSPMRQQMQPLAQQSPAPDPAPPAVEQERPEPIRQPQVEMEEEEDTVQNGHANEAFEAMEAMEFDANAEFGFDSENHNDTEMVMDMGVD